MEKNTSKEETNKKIDEKTDELLLSLFNALMNYRADQKMESFEEYLIHQAIMNAYKDATNQGAFNAVWYKLCGYKEYEQNYLKRNSEEPAEKIKKEAKAKFREEKKLDEIKKEAVEKMEEAFKKFPDLNASFDKWHRNLCEDIMNSYADLSAAFTYGNTQKWVNMAVKYLYVYASLLKRMDKGIFIEDSSLFQNIIDQENMLHVPIDSYVLKAVFNDANRNDLGEELFKKKKPDKYDYNYANKDGKLCLKQEEGKEGDEERKNTMNITELCESCFKKNGKCEKRLNSDYALTWSKIGSYDGYLLIQNKIKEIMSEKMSPLEWENRVWLEVAMKT